MRFPTLTWAALVAALAVACPRLCQAQTVLRYQFKEGEQLLYQVDAKSSGRATVAGETLKRQNSYLVETHLTVKAVDEQGRGQLTQKIERIRLKADYLGLPIDYDTQAKKEPEGVVKKLVANLKAAVGPEISFTTDRQGHRRGTKVPAELQAMAGPGGVLAFAELAGVTFPDRPVKKGDTWEAEHESASAGARSKVVTHFTYEGPVKRDGRSLEKLSFKREIRPGKGQGRADGPKASRDEGQVFFDNGAGRVVELRLRQRFAPRGGKAAEHGEATMTVRLLARPK